MASYPHDRFDDVSDQMERVGAHRAPVKKGRGWIGFGWAALATVVLTAGGLVGLAAINNNINFDLPFLQPQTTSAPTPTKEQTAEPILDPDVPLTILNGTPTPGLANQVGDALVKQGWKGAAEDVGSRANAAARDVKTTVVYYSDPSYEGAARGLVLALKAGEIRLSSDYPASAVTIVIGSDYIPIS
ncbi:MAG: LytR C-terminal domain-containing protein [Terrimesophilobacter sp.]